MWFEAGVGPIRYRIRNFSYRADALRRHDLHHVLTGYPTDWRGEVCVNAWELGAGLGSHIWGACIMLSGFFLGVVFAPQDTFRAFVRGRRSTNLYSAPLASDVLEQPVEALSLRLQITQESSPTGADVGAFSMAVIGASLFFALATIPIAVMMTHAALVSLARSLSRGFCGHRCSMA